MAVNIAFEELVEAAHQLTLVQKTALIHSLQWSVANEEVSLTREQAIAELEALRAAGAFDKVESLRGKYASPRPDISEDELNDYLRQIGREWESELDDLGSDN